MDRYFTASPRQRTPSELQIQRSKATADRISKLAFAELHKKATGYRAS